MTPVAPHSFAGEFDAVPSLDPDAPQSGALAHDTLHAALAAALPEMLDESRLALALYVTGRLTAAEYVLLDVLGGAPVVDGHAQPLPFATLARFAPGNVAARLTALTEAGWVRPVGTGYAVAPDFAARALAAVTP